MEGKRDGGHGHRAGPAPSETWEQAAAHIREAISAVQEDLKHRFQLSEDALKVLVHSISRLDESTEAMLGPDLTFVDPDLDLTLAAIRKQIGSSDDVILRTFRVGAKHNLRAAVVFVDGLVNKEIVEDRVIKPLMFLSQGITHFSMPVPAETYLHLVTEHILTIGELKQAKKLDEVIEFILSGDTALLLDGVDSCIVLTTRGWEQRSIDEPLTEANIRAPRDSFVETLRTNTSLVRRRLRDPKLRVQVLKVGKRSKTDVAVLYIEDVANKYLVQEVYHRLHSIRMDGITGSGFVEQFIEDSHVSPFPQVQSTERPDRVAANLLEGRVAILIDGTSFALIVPATFNQFYQAPDDYNERWVMATLLRFIRIVAVFFSLTFTALYVALISFHPEMLPTRFAVAVAGGRAGIPLPSVLEAFIMEGAMELLREASVRLPRPIGPTVSIVGALIIGEAATRAGVVSPLMVVVVALTTIGSYAIPSFSAAIALRILKFPIIAAAGSFGLYGLMVGLMVIVIHLASLKSFGVPYLTPLAPLRVPDLKDSLVRLPFGMMHRRPQHLRPLDPSRFSNEGTSGR